MIEKTPCPLSSENLEIVQLLSIGKTVGEIAMIFNVSEKAIWNRLERMRQRIGVFRSTAIVGAAFRNGWID